jgi:hypothetical protein
LTALLKHIPAVALQRVTPITEFHAPQHGFSGTGADGERSQTTGKLPQTLRRRIRDLLILEPRARGLPAAL